MRRMPIKKSRGKKGILNIGAIAQESENFDETFQELMSTHFKNFFESDSAVLPLFDGYEYQDISESGKTYLQSQHEISSL